MVTTRGNKKKEQPDPLEEMTFKPKSKKSKKSKAKKSKAKPAIVEEEVVIDEIAAGAKDADYKPPPESPHVPLEDVTQKFVSFALQYYVITYRTI